MAWHVASMKKIMLLALLIPAILATSPSSANDSSAAVSIGGLVLTRSDAISMDSEDLYLSREKVTVKYRFTNTSANDVETLVSFPLPAIPNEIGHMGDQSYPDWEEDLKFTTLVDGKPVALDYIEKITVAGSTNGKDVRGRLKQLGWPEQSWDDYEFSRKLNALPEADKLAYDKEGLIKRRGTSNYWQPNWQLQAHVTRKQLFPAGKTISVEHSYKPIVGGSVGGMMERSGRKDPSFKDYVAGFCIDKSFLTGFDKRRYSGKKDSDGNEVGQFYIEHWLDYVLKSGANWRGPIKDFRLVVDKGNAKNLVSFCMNGVKKISPTQFEVRKTNFEPTKDLSILIVQFAATD
jgi:hypothetical protein